MRVNKIIISCITSFIYSSVALSQDTVFVNTSNTVYVTFPQEIKLVDIGNVNDYVGEVSNAKLLKLRSLSSNAPISSIMVQYGDIFKQFVLKAAPNISKFHYAFGTQSNISTAIEKNSTTNSSLEIKSNPSQSTADTSQNLIRIKKVLKDVMAIRNEEFDIGFITDFLQAAVTVIRNDKENTYLKFQLYNKSSIPYKFDFISFQYYQSMKKGFANQKRKAADDVFPIVGPEKAEIPANSNLEVGYVIPQFGLANDGVLLINFREKTGDRVLKIKITSKRIQSAKYVR